jgi:hypothetical protein
MSEARPKKLAAGEKRAATKERYPFRWHNRVPPQGAGLSEAADESPNFRRVRWRSPQRTHTNSNLHDLSEAYQSMTR